MFRVYDKEEKCWVNNDIYMSPSPRNNLYVLKKSIFGITKLELTPVGRYTYHRSIHLYDKNDKLIFEGDYIKAQVSDDRVVTGMVAYAHELSAYVILCFECDEYFTLGTEVCKYIEVVGNVFDGFNEEEKDDNKAL